MDTTPSKAPRQRRPAEHRVQNEEAVGQNGRIKKPPPVTPRRFTRFFTPRPRNPGCPIRTSRAALRALTGSTLNSRNTRPCRPHIPDDDCEKTTPRGKKRKLSFVLADTSLQSSSASRHSISLGSQEYIRSSPTIPERRTPSRYQNGDDAFCNTDDDTDIEADREDDDELAAVVPVPRIPTYQSKTIGGSLLSQRLRGRRQRKEVSNSRLWQEETGNFYSDVMDVNAQFSHQTSALPFSAAACHTNSLVAVGDEEGRIRLLDTSNTSTHGMTRAWLTMTPHDNALMDLEFSQDDRYLATACGDQSCQIIDVQAQKSIYWLGDHRCSVKKVAFQPGSGNQVLASCGRDGQINFWDLRCRSLSKTQPTRKPPVDLPMTTDMKAIASTHMIRDAHTAGAKSKATRTKSRPNLVPGRTDFSITSLSFLGESKPHLLVTASEIDSSIKVWDIRTSYGATRRGPNPLSVTEEPRSHAHHRSFGITSIVLNTDGSRLYSLSRDHTVYAYATSHLILGSSNQLSSMSKASRTTENHQASGPLYGFRHPNMRIQTFWPRLAIRKATDRHSEILAVGSSDDCAVLFPTNERYLTSATQKFPSLHTPGSTLSSAQETSVTTKQRPTLIRASSSSISFTNRLTGMMANEDSFPIYQHGTPLVGGHDKEVTSLTWSSEGHLVTASDDYTVRCWRENAEEARRMRVVGEKNGARWRKGWSDVSNTDFDDEY